MKISSTTSTSMPSDKVNGDVFRSFDTYASSSDFTNKNLIDGMLLRYVPDLSNDDPTGVPQFFTKYLLKSPGATFEEQINEVMDIKSFWGVLRTTSSGHILSHIVKCFEIAIDAQCGIKLIFDNGFYKGAILQGNGFSLSTQDKLCLPCAPFELYEDIGALETHSRMQEIILTTIRASEVDEDEIPEDLVSMNDLRLLLLRGRFSEENRQAIKDAAAKLRFPFRKWKVNLGSLSKMLTLIA